MHPVSVKMHKDREGRKEGDECGRVQGRGEDSCASAICCFPVAAAEEEEGEVCLHFLWLHITGPRLAHSLPAVSVCVCVRVCIMWPAWTPDTSWSAWFNEKGWVAASLSLTHTHCSPCTTFPAAKITCTCWNSHESLGKCEKMCPVPSCEPFCTSLRNLRQFERTGAENVNVCLGGWPVSTVAF